MRHRHAKLTARDVCHQHKLPSYHGRQDPQPYGPSLPTLGRWAGPWTMYGKPALTLLVAGSASPVERHTGDACLTAHNAHLSLVGLRCASPHPRPLRQGRCERRILLLRLALTAIRPWRRRGYLSNSIPLPRVAVPARPNCSRVLRPLFCVFRWMVGSRTAGRRYHREYRAPVSE
ncbi:hypothetical protein GQ53DRAFT_332708 [Thozetella sp. PMI_491]|nr:hypothetical protein GQ53DRAFT_332708 [Thozetella sp. PMI_491]